jgi:hypothetical protein
MKTVWGALDKGTEVLVKAVRSQVVYGLVFPQQVEGGSGSADKRIMLICDSVCIAKRRTSFL